MRFERRIASTFNVIYPGQSNTQADQVEGNSTAENATALLGHTFGDATSPLYQNSQTLASQGTPGASYSTNNNSANEQFTVDGTVYTFDALVIYTSTITFADGAVVTLDLPIAQNHHGRAVFSPVHSR